MGPTKDYLNDAEAAELARRVEEAARLAVNKARDEYRKDGLPMVSWADGKVIWVDPVTLEEVAEPDDVKPDTAEK